MTCSSGWWTWWDAGESVAVGTVVATFESAPRPPGAVMLVGPDGEAVGSVSGGCVEGAVYQLGEEILESGEPVLQRYGVSDESAFAVGLTCGGILDVFVERVDQDVVPGAGRGGGRRRRGPAGRGRDCGRASRPGADRSPAGGQTVTTSRRPGASDRIGPTTRWPTTRAGCSRPAGRRRLEYGPDGQRRGEGMRVFVSSYAPVPRLLVFGAIDFAAAVARLGSFLGYRVTVCDARAVFATASRFPSADEVIVDWPHRYLAAEVAAGRIDGRTVDLSCSPTTRSSTYRCWRSRCGCPSRVHRCDGLPADA